MKNNYKPDGYNSVSPYFVVDGAQKLIDLLKQIFDAEELRRYDTPDGNIMHAELRIDDSVLMMGNSSVQYPPNQLMLHIYVKDVDQTFQKAIDAGCQSVEKPKEREGDPDRRGTFKDFAGNTWSISTQN
ncbi:VOC family protein [Marivirga sp. S37H4]|uniref:VOC family protein n=1 Tax=Marivirga aurantiaca TaxID=2802615 RepID=A0A934WXX0_9BACT|nr:VOC family protein [Marivirga aurantiaca]MBK6264932.1 VOC family protein [Marivirga aurantiaca]